MAVEKLTFEMNAVGNAVPQMQQVQKQLANVKKSMSAANAGLQKYANTSKVAGFGFKSMTRNLGMVGLQVQDVAVQASMGTDALRIMSMQGPQILSIFGPLGMIAGALLGVGTGIVMANGSLDGLSFDFKKFASDMAPLLEPLRPLVSAIGDAFKFVGGLAVSAVNGILTGLKYLGVIISYIPEIVRDAFSRIATRIALLQNSFAMMSNSISFAFTRAMKNMVEKAAAAANAINQTLNDAFNLGLPTDIGAGAINALGLKLEELNDDLDGILVTGVELEDALAKPNQALVDMKDALSNIESVDIASYFSRTAEAVDGGGNGGKSLTDALTAAQQRMQDVSNTLKESFTSGFMSIIDGTKSLKDAFFSMARSIIAKLFEILVVQRLVGGFDAAKGTGTGLVGGIMSLAGARAQGGPVTSGRPYLVGERGPEIIVPSRNASVIPNNQLGGGGVTVIQNNTFGSGVSRAEIQSMLPKIVETTKAAVFDAQRRRVNGFA